MNKNIKIFQCFDSIILIYENTLVDMAIKNLPNSHNLVAY